MVVLCPSLLEERSFSLPPLDALKLIFEAFAAALEQGLHPISKSGFEVTELALARSVKVLRLHYDAAFFGRSNAECNFSNQMID